MRWIIISQDECLQESKHQRQWLWICLHHTTGCMMAMCEMLWFHTVKYARVKCHTEILKLYEQNPHHDNAASSSGAGS